MPSRPAIIIPPPDSRQVVKEGVRSDRDTRTIGEYPVEK